MKEKFITLLKNSLLDPCRKDVVISYCLYSILAALSMAMAVLNVATDNGLAAIITVVFSIVCIANIGLSSLGDKYVKLTRILFFIEIFVMFTSLLIFGGPDGFAALWIGLLPALSILAYEKKLCIGINVFMITVLVFFLYTPFGNGFLKYDYSDTFKIRFPLLYFAFFIVAFALKYIQDIANDEIKKLQERYKYMAGRDQLTNVYNRQGLYSVLKENEKFVNASRFGAVMLDIDLFKNVNDTYGHFVGDKVLQEVTKMMDVSLNGVICRWGGEEFVCVYVDHDVKNEDLVKMKDEIQKHVFYVDGNEIRITVSMGVAEQESFGTSHVLTMIECADEAMYSAKNMGRNRIVYKDCANCKTKKVE